jgi:ATP-dependent Lon protease
MSDPIKTQMAFLGGELPLLPIRNAVLFPGAVAPFDIGRDKSVALVSALDTTTEPLVAIAVQQDPACDDPLGEDLYPVVCVGRVLKALRHTSGNYSLIVQGVDRAELIGVTQTVPYLRGRFRGMLDHGYDDEADALCMSLRDTGKEVLNLMSDIPREVMGLLDRADDVGDLADVLAANLDLTVSEKAEILGTLDVRERARQVLRVLTRHLEVLRMRDRINTQIKEEMGKSQREFVLRQQLKAIRDELGDDDDDGEGDLDRLEERLLQLNLPAEAAQVAKKQIKRLRQMQPGGSEYTVVRTYLDWLLDVPWTAQTDDNLDIAAVREVLDEDHYGLEKVKKRILEYLAVRKLKNDKKGPILCLQGPPGVGKTSLGRSIARAMGRKFHRVSLGGVHDEAAIRGHRRTYVGALPGQFIQAMKKVATLNPVLMLDEIDKLGRDNRGDPSAALLEVLDPEQNHTFADHYLEIPYDLSNVMFVATSNQLDTIPGPLRDRMEIIQIPGYTGREKLEIACNHLVPKQIKEHGLTVEQVQITPEAVQAIIDGYTREAGVRTLERQVASVVRGLAVRIAEGDSSVRVIQTADDVAEFLGPVRFTREVAERTQDTGVATGLAWTSVGGEILFIEATRMPGTGKFQLTGQLGDVMKESAQAALSYVRANFEKLGIPKDFLDKTDIHVHIPAGATPKDGPSAGVTMVTALVSLLTGVRVRHDVGMTGEISLRGRVLPIGGLKEKVLAAHRAGIRRIILPVANKADIEDIPADVRAELEFVLATKIDDVLGAALESD